MLSMTQKELDCNSFYAFSGMWMAFIVFLILIGSAFFFSYRGNNVGAGIFTTATVIGLVTNFLGARR
jgi:amino acid transporter